MFYTILKYLLYVTLLVAAMIGLTNIYKKLQKKTESFLAEDKEEEEDTEKHHDTTPHPSSKEPSSSSKDLDKLKRVASELMTTATQLHSMLEHFQASSLHDSEQKEVSDEVSETGDIYDQYDYDKDMKLKKEPTKPKEPKTVAVVEKDQDDNEHESSDDDDEKDGEVYRPYVDQDKIDYVSMRRPVGVKGMLLAEDTFKKQSRRLQNADKDHHENEEDDEDDEDEVVVEENFTCGYDGVTSASCLNCQTL